MKIGSALALFAASVATAVFGISVVKKHDLVSLVKEVYISQQTQVIEQAQSYILQGNNIEDIQAVLKEVGAQASHNFPIINAVSVTLTPTQLSAVKAYSDVRVQADRTGMSTNPS